MGWQQILLYKHIDVYFYQEISTIFLQIKTKKYREGWGLENAKKVHNLENILFHEKTYHTEFLVLFHSLSFL